MEEEKAAAYYEELTRKGEGAARFKQGLGFSSSSNHTRNDDVPTRGSALPPSSSSSSFLSSFVKASSSSLGPTTTTTHSQLQSIHNKLNSKKPQPSDRDRNRDRDRGRDRDSRGRRRSRSRSFSRDSRHRRRRSSSRERRRRRRSRSEDRGNVGKEKKKERNVGIDYAKLIHGFDNMTPAERVKAKMKLQLSETAEKDSTNGMGSGWERFEFDKDAPLDDEEIEAGDDDVALVKHIGQSFRFSSVEAKREDQIKAAHDEAMFGSSHILPSVNTSVNTDDIVEEEESEQKSKQSAPATSLLSDTVIARRQGSWRDRARKS